jgi:hypothetical protein
MAEFDAVRVLLGSDDEVYGIACSYGNQENEVQSCDPSLPLP